MCFGVWFGGMVLWYFVVVYGVSTDPERINSMPSWRDRDKKKTTTNETKL